MREEKRRTPGVARFFELIERAHHELKLAGDAARAEGFDAATVASVERSKVAVAECRRRAESDVEKGAEGECSEGDGATQRISRNALTRQA